MRSKLSLIVLAAAMAGCQHTPHDLPDRGLTSVNAPVVSRANYAFDVAAPYGSLSPAEEARLDAWFQSLDLRYGDTVYVDGAGSEAARAEVARVAGRYGLLVSPGAPVTAGAVAPGNVRVVVSRVEAGVPGCPNWSRPSQPNYQNRTMPNFGCAVNSNMAAMVANPQDLIYGTTGDAAVDAVAGAKAIQMYRSWPLTGVVDGQAKRPLKDVSTKKDEQ